MYKYAIPSKTLQCGSSELAYQNSQHKVQGAAGTDFSLKEWPEHLAGTIKF